MKEKVERFISLIKTGVEENNLNESDIDLLMTSLIILIEDKIRRKYGK